MPRPFQGDRRREPADTATRNPDLQHAKHSNTFKNEHDVKELNEPKCRSFLFWPQAISMARNSRADRGVAACRGRAAGRWYFPSVISKTFFSGGGLGLKLTTYESLFRKWNEWPQETAMTVQPQLGDVNLWT
ncbi:hypothetical protein [Burkholderia plantarii]|uniref:hypothetical protein n=1 Tax=Burkholderia plantarii TaxID=41899 RepID=UPI001395E0A2|nr:hypothetical protein [Burkholderia plantarii]